MDPIPDPDPVQLTVSSLGSVGGVLQDVPEHCELGADENEHSVEIVDVAKLPPKVPVALINYTSAESTVTSVTGMKNTPKVRHHSIGSRTILAANPNEGNP